MFPGVASCLTARAPFLRYKIDVIHYRPGKEGEKVCAQNEPDIVRMVFQEVAGFLVHLDAVELLLRVDTRKCTGGASNHSTQELFLTIHSAGRVGGAESSCSGRQDCGAFCVLSLR